jgi:hypothetical protein
MKLSGFNRKIEIFINFIFSMICMIIVPRLIDPVLYRSDPAAEPEDTLGKPVESRTDGQRPGVIPTRAAGPGWHGARRWRSGARGPVRRGLAFCRSRPGTGMSALPFLFFC